MLKAGDKAPDFKLISENGKEVTLNKSHIFAMMTSKHDAADQYRDSTTDIALR